MFLITLEFTGLSQSELTTLRTQWRAAVANYITLTGDGLALITRTGLVASASVRAVPGSQFIPTYQQGYAHDGSGPLVYDVQATFLTTPLDVRSSY